MFDPNSFLDSEIKDANSTTTVPVPMGEYQAVVKDVSIASGTSKDTGNPWARLNVTWSIEDEAVKKLLDRKEVTSRQAFLLDISESGALDMGVGKNVRLGRLREALGLNEKGKAFSMRMMTGRMAKVLVKHDTYEGVVRDLVDSVIKL